MKIDADLYVHPSDKAALATLKAIPGFTQVLKMFMSVWNEKLFKIQNMSTNLKLSERQMTKYYNMLPPICEKLGIEVPELYVKLDVIPNAYTYGDTNPFIVVTSGLFETLPDELIPTVLAHECGHIACHHTLYTTMGRLLLNGTGNVLSYFGGLGNIAMQPIILAFYYWMRCSEFSADRAAMIYDETSEKIIEMCMRFAGYDKDIDAEGNVDLFIAQAKDYKALMDESAVNKTMEFLLFNSYDHPLNAVRAYEAREWSCGERFNTILDYMRDPIETKLPVKLDPHKMIGKNIEEVKQNLKDLGYENVSIERKTASEKRVKPESVIDIIINDEKNCEDDYYKRNSNIKLEFFRPKTDEEISQEHPNEIKMINSSKTLLGRNYIDVQTELVNLGFTNIVMKEMAKSKLDIFAKDNQVAKILVNGEDKFDKDTWYDSKSAIVIYYYVSV